METVTILGIAVVILAITCFILAHEAYFWKMVAADRLKAFEALRAEWATAKILMPQDVRRQVDSVIDSWCCNPDITGGTP